MVDQQLTTTQQCAPMAKKADGIYMMVYIWFITHLYKPPPPPKHALCKMFASPMCKLCANCSCLAALSSVRFWVYLGLLTH